jgi:Type VI secretion system/phage-baseplate injector OB domain
MAMDDGATVERVLRDSQRKYPGKFRAFVKDNKDPEGLGRVRLIIPSVLGDAETDWALPCFPYGGGSAQGFIAVPPVDAMVVAEFMEGELSSPIWTGSFYRTRNDMPEEFPVGDPTVKILKTTSGHLLMFEDKGGSEAITLKSAKEASVVLDENGSIALTDKKGAKVTLDADAGTLVVEDANGNSLTFDSNGIAAKDSSGNEIVTEAAGITVKGTSIKIEGQSVAIGGQGGEPLVKGQSFMAMFNTHIHTCTGPGAPSSPPMVPLTPSVLTVQTKAS